ncbi:MAG: 30S ribosomal protein S6 [Candidatus Gracilibacteria bacterium]|nr:30S ribosomal protein S6 [Candidatus Gracilibacteria bacterium]MDD5179315.1 30S ribosomal protein S6 [Candidatus Gracilibacteria bacterium]
MNSMTTTTKNYELLALFAGNLKESELKKELEKIEAEVAKIGKIKHKAVWANRLLAYKVAGQTTGTYFICEFETEGKNIPEFENHLRLDPKVIRQIICATSKKYVWKDYTAEDLEFDLKKIKGEKEIEIKLPEVKASPKKINSVKDIAAGVGEVDAKLDDILDNL